MPTEYISITEAAEVANVSRQTIWRHCDEKCENRFKTAVQVGATWMIDKAEIIEYGEYYHSTEFEDDSESEEANDNE